MLLLDTHAFIWFVMDDPRMPDKIKEEIRNETNVYISIASFWEMSIKISKKKLELPASIRTLMDTCERLMISILPIAASHLEMLQTLPWIHKDPFDRLLISQAITEKLTFVTVDQNIQQYSGINTLWD